MFSLLKYTETMHRICCSCYNVHSNYVHKWDNYEFTAGLCQFLLTTVPYLVWLNSLVSSCNIYFYSISEPKLNITCAIAGTFKQKIE